MTTFGKTVKIIRQAKEISAGNLANKAGISRPFLSLIESGQREPSLSVLRKIASALDIPSETLVVLAMSENTNLELRDERAKKIAVSIKQMADLEASLLRTLEHPDDESSATDVNRD